MFAVLKTGGKQYKVVAGDIIRVERIVGEAGNSLELPHVMMISDGQSAMIGEPLLTNSLIKATILEQTRNKTVIIYKKRRRQGYDRKNGHRQQVSLLHIDEIIHEGKSIARATMPIPRVKAVEKKIAEKAEISPKVSKAQAEPKAKPQAQTTDKAAPKKTSEKEVVAKKPAASKPKARKTKE